MPASSPTHRSGTLSELCLAWHQGQLVMERATLVDVLADLFVRIDGIRPGPPENTDSEDQSHLHAASSCLCNQMATNCEPQLSDSRDMAWRAKGQDGRAGAREATRG